MSGPSDEQDYRLERLRILHVISGLGTGGAENFLLGLARSLHERVESRVVSLGEGGGMLPRFRAANIEVAELRLNRLSGRLQFPFALVRLSRMVRAWRPHVIQGWMNHGNLGAWAVRGASAPSAGLLWSVRQSVDDIRNEKGGTQLALRLQALLSPRPNRIVFNSRRGLEQHLRLGFNGGRALVIGNGFDCELFRPRPELRDRARQLLGAGGDDMVVAMIARYHSMKDHGCYIRAIGIAARAVSNLRAVCIGTGVTSEEAGIRRLVEELDLAGSVTLIDEQSQLGQLYPGIDVVCLTSAWGEGFPNVVGEAMASGVPCVVTDVGDSAAVVEDSGRVVPPREPAAIAAAILDLARMGATARAALGGRARARIMANYAMPVIANEYESLYMNLCGTGLAALPKS